MMFFARAVLTGFALSLGSAIFKKIAPKLGLGEDDKEKKDKDPDVNQQDAATDPSLDQVRHSRTRSGIGKPRDP